LTQSYINKVVYLIFFFIIIFRTVLSKTSLKTPRVELHEVGPSVDFVVRRDHMASADLFKTACKRPNIKVYIFFKESHQCIVCI